MSRQRRIKVDQNQLETSPGPVFVSLVGLSGIVRRQSKSRYYIVGRLHALHLDACEKEAYVAPVDLTMSAELDSLTQCVSQTI